MVAGDNASVEAIEAARHRLGLDKPFLVQFWDWLSGVVTGDLGTSFTSGRPVVSLIFDRLPITLSLTAGSTLIGLGIAVPLGRLRRDPAWFVDGPDDYHYDFDGNRGAGILHRAAAGSGRRTEHGPAAGHGLRSVRR